MTIITAETPRAEQPFKEPNDRLFPHQLSTLHELVRFEYERQVTIEAGTQVYDRLRKCWFYNEQVGGSLRLQTQMGVLSSPTGTGKTHPMVALAMKPFAGGQHLQKSIHINRQMSIEADIQHNVAEYLPSTLIIAPKNIYLQWMKVIRQSGVSYQGIYYRRDLHDLLAMNPDQIPKIVLCKHTLYNELVSQRPSWSRVILDEADTITIPNSRRVNAGFIWLVTATAEYLQAHPHKGYWRDVTHGVSLDILKALEITIDQTYAVECLHGQQIQRFNILCQGINNMREVTQYLPKRIQEMLAAGDYNAAVQELGGQSHSTESLTELIVKYFDTRIKATQENIADAMLIDHKHDALDQRLKDLEERKATIVEQIQKVSGSCAICHDDSADISLVQCCFQVFCTECILSWMSIRAGQACPYCKHENPTVLKINSGPKQETEEIEKDEEKESEDVLLSKEAKYNSYQTLPRLIEHIFNVDPNAKLIIVTSYNMHAFQAQLEQNRFQFNTLNHVSHRRTVQEYNSGVSPIILLDAKYNGAGIDLEQTTDIIYMQQLAGNLMKQTQGRALRLSRPMGLPLRIYFLESEEGEQVGDPIDRFICLKRIVPIRQVVVEEEEMPETTPPNSPKIIKKPLPKPTIRIRMPVAGAQQVAQPEATTDSDSSGETPTLPIARIVRPKIAIPVKTV